MTTKDKSKNSRQNTYLTESVVSVEEQNHGLASLKAASELIHGSGPQLSAKEVKYIFETSANNFLRK